MEMAPDRYRTMIGFSFQLVFALGIAVVAGWAYLIRHWPILQIIFGLHSSLMLLHWWYDIILVNPYIYTLTLCLVCDCVCKPHVERRPSPLVTLSNRGWNEAKGGGHGREKKKKPKQQRKKNKKQTTTQPNSASMSNSFERHYPGRPSVRRFN
jgi:hypothetical protein